MKWTAALACAALAVLVAAGCGKGASAPDDSAPSSKPVATGQDEAAPPSATADDVKREVKEAAKAIGSFAQAGKDDLAKRMSLWRSDLEVRMEKLEVRAADGGDDLQGRWREVKKSIVERRDAVMKKMEEAKGASEDKWGEAQKGVLEALRDFETFLGEVADSMEKKGENEESGAESEGS